MTLESDPDSSPKVRCPMCGATQARTLIRSAPIAYVRCAACGMVWNIPDRRGRYPSGHKSSATVLHIGPRRTAPSTDDPREVLWRVGPFVCELRSVSGFEFPAVLCVLKDAEPVLEVPVLSALEAEERAHGLRVLLERHQPE